MGKINFRERLKLSKETLNNDMRALPTLIYDFGLKMNHLEDSLEQVDLEIEIVEARLASSTRTRYRNVKNPPSETGIKDIVKSNPELVALKTKRLELKKAFRLARLRMKALGIKKDMIENYGHGVRLEKKSSKGNIL